MKTSIPDKNIILEVVRGDIADQPDIDIIVNAANAQLVTGGGVAGAIHSGAGPGLAEECQHLAPINTGDAVITGAYSLPNKQIIHCLGPVYGIDRPEEKLLASCYRSALNLAESSAASSIAFPAISTGIFGYPFIEALSIELDIIIQFNGYKNLQIVRLVLWGQDEFDSALNILNEKINQL
ncbi:MAG: RNase III inhibitor [Gammaproteobacteria bacterium]|nr:RNase III inhibitor [Gammaproteobacteria bacterium]